MVQQIRKKAVSSKSFVKIDHKSYKKTKFKQKTILHKNYSKASNLQKIVNREKALTDIKQLENNEALEVYDFIKLIYIIY